MAIKTSTFGGVLLTEDTAKAFEKQFIENPIKDNKLAQAAFDRGMESFKEFKEKGYITIELTKEKK